MQSFKYDPSNGFVVYKYSTYGVHLNNTLILFIKYYVIKTVFILI